MQRSILHPAAVPARQLQTAAAQQHAILLHRNLLQHPNCRNLCPQLQQGLRHRRGSSQARALLPAGAEHLLADSTVPILKIAMCCCVGAVCARQVCSWLLYGAIANRFWITRVNASVLQDRPDPLPPLLLLMTLLLHCRVT